MGSWIYPWEDGTVSLVSAESRNAAALLLDEIGEADPGKLMPVMGGFFVTLTPVGLNPGEANDLESNYKFVMSDDEGSRVSERLQGLLGNLAPICAALHEGRVRNEAVQVEKNRT